MPTTAAPLTRIEIFVVDAETDETLEELGVTATDSIGRALEMYRSDAERWELKGYAAVLRYRLEITDPWAPGGASHREVFGE